MKRLVKSFDGKTGTTVTLSELHYVLVRDKNTDTWAVDLFVHLGYDRLII